jgi:hypothetical protein
MAKSKSPTETEVMNTCHEALSSLPQDEQARVLRWLSEKLTLTLPLPMPTVPSPPPEGVIQSGITTSETVEQFMVEKAPKTDVERVTCLAYYLTKHLSIERFKTKDITKLNGEAHLPKLSNPALAVGNATSLSHYLTSVGSGMKAITPLGKSVVEALPDQEKVKLVRQSHPMPASRRRAKVTKKLKPSK